MNNFSVGDRVHLIDEDFTGVIVSINHAIASVQTDDGMMFEFDVSELVLDFNLPEVDMNLKQIDKSVFQTNEMLNDTRISKLTITPNKQIIDLHLHQLIDDDRGMSPFQKLTLQLNKVRKGLLDARQSRINKIIFIHGVGKGVLKNELINLLDTYSNLEYYDADFKTYGFGATEVRLFQSTKS